MQQYLQNHGELDPIVFIMNPAKLKKLNGNLDFFRVNVINYYYLIFIISSHYVKCWLTWIMGISNTFYVLRCS